MSITKFSTAYTAAILVAPCALPLDEKIALTSSPSLFDLSLLPRFRAALSSPSF